MPGPQSSDMRHMQYMVSSLPLALDRISILQIPFKNYLLDGDLCLNLFSFHIFSLFIFFHNDFFIYIDFTYIAASNTATDDVTN